MPYAKLKGDPEFVVLKYPWLDASRFEDEILGAVVKEFLRPGNNYIPGLLVSKSDSNNSGDQSSKASGTGNSSEQDHNIDYRKQLNEGTITDFVLENTGTAGQEARVSLGSVAGFSFRGNVAAGINLGGKLIQYKQLTNLDTYWSNLVEKDQVRSDVPRWVRNSWFADWPVCLVVGIMTCEDVELSWEGAESIEREGIVHVPIGKLAVAATATPNLLGDTVDPKVDVKTQRSGASIFRAKIPQRQIFALELRKVSTKWILFETLKLKRDGPKLDITRLAGDESDDDNDNKGYDGVTVDDLVLAEFDDTEYNEMMG